MIGRAAAGREAMFSAGREHVLSSSMKCGSGLSAGVQCGTPPGKRDPEQDEKPNTPLGVTARLLEVTGKDKTCKQRKINSLARSGSKTPRRTSDGDGRSGKAAGAGRKEPPR